MSAHTDGGPCSQCLQKALPPINMSEQFWRMCLQSHLRTYPTTLHKSYAKFQNPMILYIPPTLFHLQGCTDVTLFNHIIKGYIMMKGVITYSIQSILLIVYYAFTLYIDNANL